MDSITNELTNIGNETVDAIINIVGTKTKPPEAYDHVSWMIAQELAIIVAASVLDYGDVQML